ncbi:MAG: START domain-containing protein [Marinicella pacifica]
MPRYKHVSLLLICFIAVADAITVWSLIEDKAGVQVFSREESGQDLKRFKAQTRIDDPADTILAALQDTKACPEWVHNCVSNKMVEMIDVKTRIYHTTVNAPLWFKHRDFYQQAHVVYEPKERVFTISFQSRPDYAPESNQAVRIHDVEMTWTLKAVGQRETEVTYEVYIDPRLPFKSINHAMIKRSMYKTLQGLAEIVQSPKYKGTTYTEAELEMLSEDE